MLPSRAFVDRRTHSCSGPTRIDGMPRAATQGCRQPPGSGRTCSTPCPMQSPMQGCSKTPSSPSRQLAWPRLRHRSGFAPWKGCARAPGGTAASKRLPRGTRAIWSNASKSAAVPRSRPANGRPSTRPTASWRWSLTRPSRCSNSGRGFGRHASNSTGLRPTQPMPASLRGLSPHKPRQPLARWNQPVRQRRRSGESTESPPRRSTRRRSGLRARGAIRGMPSNTQASAFRR